MNVLLDKIKNNPWKTGLLVLGIYTLFFGTNLLGIILLGLTALTIFGVISMFLEDLKEIFYLKWSKKDLVIVCLILIALIIMIKSPTKDVPDWQYEKEQQEYQRNGTGRF